MEEGFAVGQRGTPGGAGLGLGGVTYACLSAVLVGVAEVFA